MHYSQRRVRGDVFYVNMAAALCCSCTRLVTAEDHGRETDGESQAQLEHHETGVCSASVDVYFGQRPLVVTAIMTGERREAIRKE